jgi:hypothetical protein
MGKCYPAPGVQDQEAVDFLLRIEAIDQSAPPHLTRIQFGASADFSMSSGPETLPYGSLALCFALLTVQGMFSKVNDDFGSR